MCDFLTVLKAVHIMAPPKPHEALYVNGESIELRTPFT